MNKVIQTVGIVKDITSRTYGSDNKSMATFRGAVNKRFVSNGGETSDYFNYVAYGKTADFITKYCKVGTQLLITGSVENNNYKDKQGNMVYGTQIVIDSVEFFGRKPKDKDDESSAPANTADTDTTTAEDDTATDSVDANGYLDF